MKFQIALLGDERKQHSGDSKFNSRHCHSPQRDAANRNLVSIMRINGTIRQGAA